MVKQRGFTLIELSIVLVIIGLLIGGVLVGQDLVSASEMRSTITQLEKYNTAVNTFRGKYGYLPGDLIQSVATQFGFAARGTLAGEGDGDGILNGIDQTGSANNNALSAGETAMFWEDLSKAGMIEGNFATANATTAVAVSNANLGLYMPAAKLGKGNYVYAYSGGYSGTDGSNYFGIAAVTDFSLSYGSPDSNVSIPVKQAYGIDSKIDDGLPMMGRVLVWYDSHAYEWAGSTYVGSPTTAATVGSATTCFDNSATANGTPGVAGAKQHYSVEINNGSGPNCAISIRLQ